MDAQAFLEANKLKLIIRSHEGPDARWKREGMQNMDKGHSLDHVMPGLFLPDNGLAFSAHCRSAFVTHRKFSASQGNVRKINMLQVQSAEHSMTAFTPSANSSSNAHQGVIGHSVLGCCMAQNCYLCKHAHPLPSCPHSTTVKDLSAFVPLMHWLSCLTTHLFWLQGET